MTDRELMQQALEALESDPISHAGLVNRKQAITALRERLAQPEQKPVRFKCTVVDDAHPNGVPLSQWQGLTEEDLFDIAMVNFGEPDLQLFIEMGKLVQEELKEKNT